MADSQIKNLTSRTPTFSDYLPTQGASGDAGKTSLTTLRDILSGGLKKAVLTMSKSGSVSGTILYNDFDGVTFDYANPTNGNITITASSSVFTDNKTQVKVGNYNNGGTLYVVTASQSGDVVYISFFEEDGTQAGTPNFQNVFVEIVVYP